MYEITLIPGDGIGPEVAAAAVEVLEATGVVLKWREVNAGSRVLEETGTLVPDAVYESIEKTRVALKGPITTPVGKGFRSINVQLRKKYDLYANIRPVRSLPLERNRYRNVDFTIFRENTEGLYAGIERQDGPDRAEAIKVVTRAGSERILRAAFTYARTHGLGTVTVAHKANILKLADGLFLKTAREVAADFTDLSLKETIIDNMCMQLVMYPEDYGVIVTTNLYGDIISDLGAGLVGGLGLVPGANIGDDTAIFEAVHGSAPDIAGKGWANPIALILSGAMMLDHLGEEDASHWVRRAVERVLENGRTFTRDLGGTASTTDMARAIAAEVKQLRHS